MEGRRRVLSEANGRPDAQVMILAEAPGRLGGDRTGVPLVSDASGRHFSLLLAEANVDRSQLFITNAVLCNPRDGAGRNRKPTHKELDSCSNWLRRQIALIDPVVIVTLGATALAALASLQQHAYALRLHVGRPLPWAGRTLVPLYHPSPLTRASRGDDAQAEDFRWLGEYLRRRGLVTGTAGAATGPLSLQPSCPQS
ncbi:MAG: uracil-DNA glycosylase family protein [Dehalococcoidia bacterium]